MMGVVSVESTRSASLSVLSLGGFRRIVAFEASCLMSWELTWLHPTMHQQCCDEWYVALFCQIGDGCIWSYVHLCAGLWRIL